MGEIRLRHLEDRGEIREHLPRFFSQHVARRAEAGDRSLFCDDASQDFYRALVDEFDPRGKLRFAVLEVGNRPAAYHLGFESHGTFYWYKPTFDVDLWDYSPGEVLIKRLFEYAGQRGLERFDFTVGEEAFKMRFANQVNRNYTLHLDPAGLRGSARRWARRVKDHVRRQWPLAFRAGKALARAPQRLWSRWRDPD